MTVHLAVDGLSLLLVALTCVVGMVAVLASWREVDRRVGRFHALLLWALAGIVGVFVSLDLILFYFFWELMLVPTYFSILWGHDRQLRAALKFFVFTQTQWTAHAAGHRRPGAGPRPGHGRADLRLRGAAG